MLCRAQSGATSEQLPTQTPIEKDAPEIVTKDAPAVFQSRVTLVSVPVVVRDGSGKAVGTLAKESFQLFDRGKLQEITRFSVEKSRTESTPSATPVEPSGTTRDVTLPERFTAYLFDDVHISFADLVRARDAVGRQLATMRATDRAAIFTVSGENQIDFTDDAGKLQDTLSRLRIRSVASPGGVPLCPDISYYMAGMILNKNDTNALNLAGQEALVCSPGLTPAQANSMARAMANRALSTGSYETRQALSFLRELIRRMAAAPGQRIVVFVSPGFITPEDQYAKSELIDAAVRSSVLINSLDARGLWVEPVFGSSASQRSPVPAMNMLKQQYDRAAANSQADVLAELAAGTGAAFVEDTNDFDKGLQLLATPPEYYYVLGFSPLNLKADGSFHNLTVKLQSASGAKIQARKGYFAPKKPTDPEEAAKQQMEDSLFSREELVEFPLDVTVQYSTLDEKAATVSVVSRFNPREIQFRKADDRSIDKVTVITAIFDRNGNFVSATQKIMEFRLKEATLSKLIGAGKIALKSTFSVAPGTYMIRVVARDSEGQIMSTRSDVVTIK